MTTEQQLEQILYTVLNARYSAYGDDVVNAAKVQVLKLFQPPPAIERQVYHHGDNITSVGPWKTMEISNGQRIDITPPNNDRKYTIYHKGERMFTRQEVEDLLDKLRLEVKEHIIAILVREKFTLGPVDKYLEHNGVYQIISRFSI